MDNHSGYLKHLIEEEVFLMRGDTPLIDVLGEESLWMFDFKKVLLQGEFLNHYASHFLESNSEGDFQIAGLEVGALPLLAAIVMKSKERGMPVHGFFIRKSRRKSGAMNLIEGTVSSLPIILVDDILHSGRSFEQQVELLEKLRHEGVISASVKKVHALVRYRELSGYPYFTKRNIAIEAVFELNDFRETLGIENTPIPKARREEPRTILWHYQAKNPRLMPVLPKSGLLIHEEYLYVGGDNGEFMCLDARSGKKVWGNKVGWQRNERDQFSTPVFANGNIIVGGRDGNVYAFDASTGKRSWVYLEADWINGSPGVHEELGYVFMPLSFGLFKKHGKLVALETVTGKKAWEYEIEAPILGGVRCDTKSGRIYFGSEDGYMHGLECRTGKGVWREKIEVRPRGFPNVSDDGALVLVTGEAMGKEKVEQAYLYAFDAHTGKRRWVYDGLRFGSYSTPLIFRSMVYVTGLDAHLHGVSIENGQCIWKKDLGARCFSSPTLIKEKATETPIICIGTNAGRIVEVDAETGQTVRVSYLSERVLDAVVFDTDRETLLVPTQANEVYALR